MKIPQTKRYGIYKKLVLQDKKSEKLNFEQDGREHYVYRVTDYTRSEKQHYYGSHTPNKEYKGNDLIKEFWTYKTSSKYNILNENKKENYKVKILKIFDNPADKIIYEAFLHQYFDVMLHNNFWNKNNQCAFNYFIDGSINKNYVSFKGYRVTKEYFDNNKLKGNTTGKTVFTNDKGEVFQAECSDERFLTGIIYGINKGKSLYINDSGDKVFSNIKPENFYGRNKGMSPYKNNKGETKLLRNDDPVVLSGEYKHTSKGKATFVDLQNKIIISADTGDKEKYGYVGIMKVILLRKGEETIKLKAKDYIANINKYKLFEIVSQ